MQGLSLRL